MIPIVGGTGLGDEGLDELAEGRLTIERLLDAVFKLFVWLAEW
jgi:hypothetical protein